jgi:peroxiredoxin
MKTATHATLRAALLTTASLLTPLAAPASAAPRPSAIVAASGDAAPAALSLGRTAPLADTPMKSVDGSDVSIAKAAGKNGTLVIFMCNHCPWVKAWQTRIASIGNDAVTRGVGVIAVNSNDPAQFPEDDFDSMKGQAETLGLKFPYVVDATSDVGRAFGATRTPEAFLFDAKGKLVYHGTVDDNARNEQAVAKTWLRDAVTAVAGGRRVPVAETKAFGCGIKLRAKSST